MYCSYQTYQAYLLVSLVRAIHSSQEKSKSGKGTKSNSIHYDQVKDPIFGKARKGKSSKMSKSSSSKGSKKSKLFGQMATGTASPTTDTLDPKSWKGSSSSEDGGGTYRVYAD